MAKRKIVHLLSFSKKMPASLPGDVLSAILGRTDADSTVAFATACRATAAAVRANRVGIWACRGPDFGDRTRAADDARALFADGHRIAPTACLPSFPEKSSQAKTVVINFPRTPWRAVALATPHRRTLNSLLIPVASLPGLDRVQLVIGVNVLLDLSNLMLRTMAVVDGFIDIVRDTIGSPFPLTTLENSTLAIRMGGHSCLGIRATFSVASDATQPALVHRLVRVRMHLLKDIYPSEELAFAASSFRPFVGLPPAREIKALLVLIERKEDSAIVDDVAEAIVFELSEKHIRIERSFCASALRARLVPVCGITRGYALPVPVPLNFALYFLRVRVVMRRNVDPRVFRVTFGHVSVHHMNVDAGLMGT